MTSIKSVCVYCGSSPGARSIYADAAKMLAEAMVAEGVRLVYGGASIGLMGTVADQVLSLGGNVVGVIPEALVRKEVAHYGLSELHVVSSMHERKMRMAELSDAFIALPGGLGTLEELFEILTWAQLGIHQKPCGLLNADGYYDPLIAFLDHTVNEQFVRSMHRDMLLVDDNPRNLLARFAYYVAPDVGFRVSSEET